MLELDIWWHRLKNDIVVCHQMCHFFFPRTLKNVFIEIKNWISKNPEELIFLKFDDYIHLSTNLHNLERFTNLTKTAFADKIFTPVDLEVLSLLKTSKYKWPSINTIVGELKKNLIIMPQRVGNSTDIFFDGGWGGPYKNLYKGPNGFGRITSVQKYFLSMSEITPVLKDSSGYKLWEIGEDKTLLGQFNSITGNIMPTAGIFKKEDIEFFRHTRDVNFLGMDDIRNFDSRFVEGYTFFDLLQNWFVRFAILSLAVNFSPKTDINLSWKESARKIAIHFTVASVLGFECMIVYSMMEQVKISYNKNKNSEASGNSEISKIFDSGFDSGYLTYLSVVKDAALAGGAVVLRAALHNMLTLPISMDDKYSILYIYFNFVCAEALISGIKTATESTISYCNAHEFDLPSFDDLKKEPKQNAKKFVKNLAKEGLQVGKEFGFSFVKKATCMIDKLLFSVPSSLYCKVRNVK